MTKHKLSVSLQENLLVLLIFNKEKASLIRNTTDEALFEGDYQLIAGRAYSYLDQYKTPPEEHISDILEDVLTGDDEKKAKRLGKVLYNIYENEDTVNTEYAMDQLGNFIRQQTFKAGLMKAAQKVQEETDEALDEAESIMTHAMKHRLDLFKPGVFFNDVPNTLNFLNAAEESFPTGITELDHYNLGPGRKELFLVIALIGRGKTWFMINLAKYALMNRKKVCHISLEMSEDEMCQRYYQAFGAIAKRRDDQIFATELILDNDNHLIDLDKYEIHPRIFLDDENVRADLLKRSTEWGIFLKRLLVKQFPTGGLTIKGLTGYLDSLETSHNFIPDLLIVDYADLFHIEGIDHRIALGNVVKELRGVAVERNIAVVTASQSNREGTKAKRITEGHVAEDWSKVATADVVLTYNQSEEENRRGLARLYVAKGRKDRDKFTVLISQSYATGQFVLESTPMIANYWDMMEDE